MKNYDLTKWKDVEEYCSDILSKGGTKSFSEVKEFQKSLSELQIHSTKRRTIAKVEEASQFVRQLLKDKTPWYRSNSFPITIFGVVLAAILAKIIDLYLPSKEGQGLPLQSPQKEQTTGSSKLSKNNRNSTLNKSSNTEGEKTASGNTMPSLSSLKSIVNAINASNQDNLGKVYEGLVALLGRSNASDNLMTITQYRKEALAAKTLGNTIVISTIDQYKIDGFILFFDSDTESLIYASYDFGLGIKAIKTFETKQSSPEYLVSVKYMTQSGTGLYGESVRIYAVSKEFVSEALNKPYREYLDGSWGAYKSDVNFEQNNKLAMDEGFPKLTTIGRVTYTKADHQEVQVELPLEEYTWDINRSIFKQVSGRQTKNRKMMSEMYADYAEPNGDWFEMPRDSNDSSFSAEQW